MSWKEVGKKGAAAKKRNEKLTVQDVVTDMYPNGFRTFDTLESVFNRVLITKLRQHYPRVQFHAETTDGETNAGGYRYRYVNISMRGPACDVNDAFVDAVPFLKTDKNHENRGYLQRTWAPPPDAPLGQMQDRAALAADQLGIAVNYSPGKKAFFVTTIFLQHDLEKCAREGRTIDSLAGTMVAQARDFLSSVQQTQTFRSAPASAASRGGRGGYDDSSPRGRGAGGRGRGGGGRGGGFSFSDAGTNMFLRELEALRALPAAEAKPALLRLFEAAQRERPADDLAWLQLCYEFEAAYLLHDFAQNETHDLDIRVSRDHTNIGELAMRPDSGNVPFMQRLPRIKVDDKATIRFPTGDTIEVQIYQVTDFKIYFHISESDVEAECLTNVLRFGGRVSISFDPGPIVGSRRALQRALNEREAFDRIRGYGQYRESIDADFFRRQMASDQEFRTAREEQQSVPHGHTGGRGGHEPSASRGGAGDGGGRGGRGGSGGSRMERGGFRGPQPAAATGNDDEDIEDSSLLTNLSSEQRFASFAVARKKARRIFIDGPGGTGKTETVARTVSFIRTTSPETRMLIVAPTVAAGDVLALRIMKVALEFGIFDEVFRDLARLYSPRFHPIYCDQKLYPYANRPERSDKKGTPLKFNEVESGSRFMQESDYFERIADRCRIVICSTTTARHLPQDFLARLSYVFVDEAGSTSLAEAMGVVAKVPPQTTIVMSGDPLQLLPRSYCPFTKQALQASPLRHFETALRVPLRTSHRSSASLVALQSMLFYNGELLAAHARDDVGDDDEHIDPTCFPRWTGHGQHPNSVRIIHNQGEESRTGRGVHVPGASNTVDLVNKSETEIVTSICMSLKAECGVLPEDIGVICEYPQQQREVRQRLAMVSFKKTRVSGIDDFQGNERTVMIAMLTRSRFDPKDTDVIDLHKLCTVFTRAKALTLIVGNVPVYLERDMLKHKKRKSKGKFTEVVEVCLERMAVDGYDYDTETYEGAKPLPVKTSIDVKAFEPSQHREDRSQVETKRRMVSKSEVMANPHEYVIGTVIGRDQRHVLVRNRWQSVMDIAIDEDVASGKRGYAVFPGDVVAVSVDPNITRWLTANQVGSVPEQTPAVQRLPGNVPRSEGTSPADFPQANGIAEVAGMAAYGTYRPTGAIACILARAKVHPGTVPGMIYGNFFRPAVSGLPVLEVHIDRTTGKPFTPTPDTRYEASVLYRPDEAGDLQPCWVPNSVPMVDPLPAVGLSTHEHDALLHHSTTIDDQWVAVTTAKVSRQWLTRILAYSEVGGGFSVVRIGLIAPAVGIMGLLHDSPAAEHVGRQCWSDWAAKERRGHGAFPDCSVINGTVFDGDGFQLPPPVHDTVLMVGVEFELQFFDMPYPTQPPAGYTGPVLTGNPEVLRVSRKKTKCVEVQDDMADYFKRIFQTPTLKAAEASWWKGSLLHWANHAAALCLLRLQPNAALLLRQTEAPHAEDEEVGVADAPEWYVASTTSPDGASWELLASHAPSSLSPYTSFTHAHHSYGDMLVQHLLLAAEGQRCQNLDVLLGSLRAEALRINATTIQNCA